jgi:hypothetical protein
MRNWLLPRGTEPSIMALPATRCLLSTGQMAGGAIGPAALGAVAWTAVADSVRTTYA